MKAITKYVFVLSCFLSLLLLVAGCDSDDKNKEKNENTIEQTSNDLAGKPMKPISPGKYGEQERVFLTYPGKYSGKKFDEAKIKAEIAKVPTNWKEDRYKTFLLSLLAEDYRPLIQKFNTLSADVKISDPNISNDIKLPADKKVHFSILLDASGSMGATIGGRTKMDIAKEAVKKFVSTLPKNAQISLRVYGQKGTGSNADKAMSCATTNEIYRSEGYQESQFQSALNTVQPSGWTPLAKAIDSVQQDIKPGETESYVYIVSDGKETCGGNPVAAAKKLNQSQVKTVVNIIGFNVANQEQQSLRQVAQAGGGEFISVNNEAALRRYLDEQKQLLTKKWEEWMQKEWESADDQATQIHEKATQIQKQFDDLSQLEEARLLNAREWLEEALKQKNNGNLPDNYPGNMYGDLADRQLKIQIYANGRRFDKFIDSRDKAGQAKQHVTDKGSDNINDIDN